MTIYVCDCCSNKAQALRPVYYTVEVKEGEKQGSTNVFVEICDDCLAYVNKVISFTITQLKEKANGTLSEESEAKH